MNIDSVQAITVADGSVLRRAVFMISDFCFLVFDEEEDPRTSKVWVRQEAEGTWTVQTQAPPNDVAYCRDGVRGYHLPFGITVSLLEN
jgi:hypothetical protein